MIDPAEVEMGKEVSLVWGEPNGGSRKTSTERHKQADIRVRVSPTPYAREARESYAQGWRTRAS
jgi:vanillate/3-O-methylgallate O-demethylase